MAELKWHNTRKSQFLVIARIMPFFVFLTFYISLSAKFSFPINLKILQEGGTMSKKKESRLTVVTVNKPNLDGLSKDDARALFRSLLDSVLKIKNDKESEEN